MDHRRILPESKPTDKPRFINWELVLEPFVMALAPSDKISFVRPSPTERSNARKNLHSTDRNSECSVETQPFLLNSRNINTTRRPKMCSGDVPCFQSEHCDRLNCFRLTNKKISRSLRHGENGEELWKFDIVMFRLPE